MQKTSVMEALAAGVADGEIASVLTALPRRDLSTEFASLLLRRWAGLDPGSAAHWIETAPNDPARIEMMSQLAVVWAGSDPTGATAWLEKQPVDPARTGAAMALAVEIGRADQPLAIEIISTLPPTRDRDNLIEHTIAEWASTDPRAVGSWIGQIGDHPLRDRMAGALAASIAKQDGVGAANLVATEVTPGDSQARAAVAVALRWAQFEPDAAAEWVGRFPDIALRKTAMEDIASLSRLGNQSSASP